MRVVVLVNRCNSTTIPVDIANRVADIGSVELTIASFFESESDPSTENNASSAIDLLYLNADHRLDFSAYRKLRSYIQSNKIDILHTHHNSVGSIARALTIGCNVCVVNTEHRNHRFFTPLQRLVNFPTFLITDHLISNSKETKNSFYWYENLFARFADHHIIYNGFDFDKNNVEVNKSVSNGGPVIVSVGRLVSIKNHETVLRVFSKVREQNQEAKLVLVGGGDQNDKLTSLATELGISDGVEFTGNVSRERVYDILSNSDLFILASRSEGFCVAVVEAMVHELPVVISDIPTLREVVGGAGTFSDPEDISGFSTAINYLLENPEERRRLGRLGNKRARGQFPLDRTAKQYIEVYKQCFDNL